MTSPRHVLFLCTGNSARSILAESLLNELGRGEFVAFSAGSFPKGQVHPVALELLQQMKHPVAGLRSKSWDEFAAAGAPRLDFIFTVCDNAAAEVCPLWPGHPISAHWGLPDPAAVTESREAQWAAFHSAWTLLSKRIQLFLALPFAALDPARLQARLREIGTAQ